MYAVCDRSGRIFFGDSIPRGQKLIAKGPEKPLRKLIATHARLGPEKTMLVPGVPEAADDKEAVKAIAKFISKINRSLPECP